ncbi:MAG: hypothetical protein ACYTEQ_15200 [Planctomycetota bacterium]
MARSKKKATRKRRIARVHEDSVTMEDVEVVAVCEKSHRNVPIAACEVPHNQKAPFRHRCAGCAYEMGYRDGYNAALKALQQAAPLHPPTDPAP